MASLLYFLQLFLTAEREKVWSKHTSLSDTAHSLPIFLVKKLCTVLSLLKLMYLYISRHVAMYFLALFFLQISKRVRTRKRNRERERERERETETERERERETETDRQTDNISIQ